MAGPAMTRMRGAAIILAMLIAALAAAVAATVFADQQRWVRTVEHRRDQVQSQALAIAAEAYGQHTNFAGAGACHGGGSMGAADPR